jgi:hypothetical protein
MAIISHALLFQLTTLLHNKNATYLALKSLLTGVQANTLIS